METAERTARRSRRPATTTGRPSQGGRSSQSGRSMRDRRASRGTTSRLPGAGGLKPEASGRPVTAVTGPDCTVTAVTGPDRQDSSK